MFKHIRKLLAVVLLIAMIATLIGCGTGGTAGGNQASGPKKLVIKFFKGGYGDEWLYAMADAFEEAYKDEGYEVEIEVKASGGSTVAEQELKLGPEKNDVDLYFASSVSTHNVLNYSKKVMRDETTPLLEPLNDIYNAPAVGADKQPESKTIAERTFAGFEDSYLYKGTNEAWQGKIFNLSEFASSTGLFVNTKVLEKYGVSVPNTTDEFAAAVKTISQKGAADGVYPFTWAGNNAPGYWYYLWYNWFAQYSGVEAFNNWVATMPESGDVKNDGWQVYEDRGILEAFKAMEPLMELDYSADGAVNFTHTEAQHYLMVGEAAFMVTGDWLLSEMKKDYMQEASTDVQMVKTPVASVIGTELGISDAQLSQAVSMIDSGKSNTELIAAVPGLQEAGAQRIRDARGIYTSIGSELQVMIPAYSDAKEVAKKFIQFLYSEDGCRIVRDNAYALVPVTCDSYEVSEPTVFLESVVKTFDNGNAVAISMNNNKSVVRSTSGMLEFNYSSYCLPNTFKSMMMDKSITAQYIYETELAYVKSNWANWVAYAGLS